MTRSTSYSASIIALALLLAPRPALADDVRAEAERLFRAGRDLIRLNQWREACPMFEESRKIYASPTILLNLAQCAEHDADWAGAHRNYAEAKWLNKELTTDTARRQELDGIANAGIDALKSKLAFLTAQSSVTDHSVTIIVEPGRHLLTVGNPYALNPGEYRITAVAHGYEGAERAVTLSLGETRNEVFDLEPISSSGGLRPPSWRSWLLGGSGLALGAAAAGFAVAGANLQSDLTARCGSDHVCDEDPSFDPSEDSTRKNAFFGVAIGAGVLGGVALGLGITHWLVVDTRVAVDGQGARVDYRVRF